MPHYGTPSASKIETQVSPFGSFLAGYVLRVVIEHNCGPQSRYSVDAGEIQQELQFFGFKVLGFIDKHNVKQEVLIATSIFCSNVLQLTQMLLQL
jgi:hypothetical protein